MPFKPLQQSALALFTPERLTSAVEALNTFPAGDQRSGLLLLLLGSLNSRHDKEDWEDKGTLLAEYGDSGPK